MKSKIYTFLLALAALAALAVSTSAAAQVQTAKAQNSNPAKVSLSISGLNMDMKWETGDKLMLNFQYNGSYYKADAPIVPASISGDGKTAQFTITVPSEIPADATFDLYGVYQKTNEWTETNGGYFLDGTNTYRLEYSEEECITYNQLGTIQTGILRPMLKFSQTGVTQSTIGEIALQHTGWVMAVTFRNATSAEMQMPLSIGLDGESDWCVNGFPQNNGVDYDCTTGSFSTQKTELRLLEYNINQYNWLPLSGKTLAAGASYTYYRWIAGSTNVPALTAELQINYSTAVQTASTLSAKTTALGKVYHVNVEWNGTNCAYVGTQWAEGSLNTLNISKEASTGLETLTSQGIQVRGGKGEIRIDSPLSLGRGAGGEVAYVYNVSGMLVRTLLLPLQGAGGQVSVPAGIYIVRIGNGAEKVAVR